MDSHWLHSSFNGIKRKIAHLSICSNICQHYTAWFKCYIHLNSSLIGFEKETILCHEIMSKTKQEMTNTILIYHTSVLHLQIHDVRPMYWKKNAADLFRPKEKSMYSLLYSTNEDLFSPNLNFKRCGSYYSRMCTFFTSSKLMSPLHRIYWKISTNENCWVLYLKIPEIQLWMFGNSLLFYTAFAACFYHVLW